MLQFCLTICHVLQTFFLSLPCSMYHFSWKFDMDHGILYLHVSWYSTVAIFHAYVFLYWSLHFHCIYHGKFVEHTMPMFSIYHRKLILHTSGIFSYYMPNLSIFCLFVSLFYDDNFLLEKAINCAKSIFPVSIYSGPACHRVKPPLERAPEGGDRGSLVRPFPKGWWEQLNKGYPLRREPSGHFWWAGSALLGAPSCRQVSPVGHTPREHGFFSFLHAFLGIFILYFSF